MLIWGKDSKWIWHENQNTNKQENEIVYFRRDFNIKDPSNLSLTVRISADTRYRLYINEILVSSGPCKGEDWYKYYETVDLTSYLKKGKNTVCAKVLHLSNRQPYQPGICGSTSIYRSSSGGFLLDGVVVDTSDNSIVEDISTNKNWLTKIEAGIELISAIYGLYASIFEHIKGNQYTKEWKNIQYDSSTWDNAKEIADSLFTPKPISNYGQTNGWDLKKREIPQLFEKKRFFKSITKSNLNFLVTDKKKAEDFLDNKESIVVPKKSNIFIDIDASELTTGYLNIGFNHGKGSLVKIIYSECYEEYHDGQYKKGVRDDSKGEIRGDFDIIEPAGGTESYETFWFRTFRFVRLEITTLDEKLNINNLFYNETGYPLEIEGTYESSDKSHSTLWDISIRSLRRCMHETYEDCPYYEQLQYIMDTRLQALFTYQISSDDRLARKAIEEFHASLMPNGLLQSRYPSVIRQVIPGFALHWIFMIKDHLMYFGNIEFIKKYRSTIDAILGWFDRKLDNNGLVGHTGYWSFVDWVEEWDQVSIPPAHKKGGITVYSLMYVLALKTAAFINNVTGRQGIADEYNKRAQYVSDSIRNHCWDQKRKLFTDGAKVMEYSEHVQVWAILADVVTKKDAVNLIDRTLDENLPKISYAMSYYLFRALEKTGRYHKVDKLLDTWRNIAKLNLTTWVEDPVTQRSDCHGWGAIPLYEFPAMVLGVKPMDIGYSKIQICPHIGTLEFASGTVATSRGSVYVNWHIENNNFFIQVNGPSKVKMDILLPNGNIYRDIEGNFDVFVTI